MGRSGLVGLASLLLLTLAALIVLSQSGPGAGRLPWAAAPDTLAAGTGVSPLVQPYRSVAPAASVDQADRMIQDIEQMGGMMPER